MGTGEIDLGGSVSFESQTDNLWEEDLSENRDVKMGRCLSTALNLFFVHDICKVCALSTRVWSAQNGVSCRAPPSKMLES
jgi:hypothetical protein